MGVYSSAMTLPQVAAVVKSVHGGPPSGTSVAEWVAKADQEARHVDGGKLEPETVNAIGAVGLWQVRDFHAALVQRFAAGIRVPQERDQFRNWLKSPFNNWLATKAVYDAQGWGAWAASGGRPTPAARHKAAAADPDASGATSGAGILGPDGTVIDEPGVEQTSLGDVARAAGGYALEAGAQLARLADILTDAAGWLSRRENWTRVALVVGGGGVALIAAAGLTRPAWEPAAKVAGKAADIAL